MADGECWAVDVAEAILVELLSEGSRVMVADFESCEADAGDAVEPCPLSVTFDVAPSNPDFEFDIAVGTAGDDDALSCRCRITYRSPDTQLMHINKRNKVHIKDCKLRIARLQRRR